MGEQPTDLGFAPENPLVTQFKQQDTDGIVAKSLAMAVNTDAEYSVAGDYLVKLRALIRKATDFFAPSIKAADLAHKAAIAIRTAAIGEVQTAERHISAQTDAFAAAREKERLAAAKAKADAEAEAARKVAAEQEERQRIADAAEAVRLKKAEDERIATAEAAEATGNTELAEELLGTPVEVEPAPGPVAPAPAPAPVATPPAPPPLPKIEGLTRRTNWKARAQSEGGLLAFIGAIVRGQAPLSINGEMTIQINTTALDASARQFRANGEMYPGIDCYDAGGSATNNR